MLNLININKKFRTLTGEKVLFKDFNIRIGEGEFVSIVGSNGCGKTSLFNIICGNLLPEQGEIFLKEKNITKTPIFKKAKRIGRVFQDPAMGVCPSMTVLENLSLAVNKNKPFNLTFCINKKNKDFFKNKLSEFSLGLENCLDTKAGDLSGGQKQALALLIATITDIDILILDEHTAALDPSASYTIMEITKKIVEEKKITALMITHDLKHSVNYGNRLIMMHEGKIVLDKKADEKKLVTVQYLENYFDNLKNAYAC